MDEVVKKATAAILMELNEPLEIVEVNLPNLLYGQVLVKVMFSGVCRSQVMEMRGGRGPDHWLPHMLGHEGSGIVLSIGEGVTKVAPGDAVILGWVKGSGIDSPGAVYTSGNQIINSGRVTTFSNYTIASESRLVKKPATLPFDIAVLFGCALPTGAGMVFNELKPSLSESVALIGLGGIGLSALVALKAAGIQEIITVDVSDEKLLLSKKLGATYTINANSYDVLKEIKSITGDGVDICIESAGTVKTIELGFSVIKKTGRLLFASHPPNDEVIRLSPHDLISGKKISGTWGGGTSPDADIPKMFEILKGADSQLHELITKTYELEEINLALSDLECGRVFRPLIVMRH